VGIHLAATNPDSVKGLIVENTFASIAEVAPKVFPPLGAFVGPGRPFNFLIRNKWNNTAQVVKLHSTPLLLLSSLKVPLRSQGHSRFL
jgi:abhydrolase domain-containing protein 13